MTRPKIWGGSLGPTDVSPAQVPTVPATKSATAPIPYRKFCNNGASPSAQFINLLNESTNAAALYRGKQVFAATGVLGSAAGISASSASGTRLRWRGAFHLGPYASALLCRVFVHPQDGLTLTAPSAVEVKIYSNATESSLSASGRYYYGQSPTGTAATSGWEYCRTGDIYLGGLSPDTAYYVTVADVDYCRTQSISIAEMLSMTDNFGGYLPQNITSESSVFAKYRNNVALIQKNLWRRGGAQVLSWSVEIQSTPRSIASATPTNLIDNSTTTVSASSPGFTIDMSNKDRLSQTTGVPVTIKVFCSTTSVGGSGRIYLKDSAGTAIATINGSIPVTTPSWISTTATLPASVDKYDIQYDNNSSGTLRVHAVSIYEYEA
jgi:hypothetical protein